MAILGKEISKARKYPRLDTVCAEIFEFMLRIIRSIQRIMTSISEGSSNALDRVLSGRVEKTPSTSTADLPKALSNEELNDVIDDGTVIVRQRMPKTIRYALLLAYQGKNYYGMQLQQKLEFPTIESHLLSAMHKFGILTEEQSKNPYDFHFQRAARTDRSVSAVRQVCSMLLPLNQEFLDVGPQRLNEFLPSDIRVLDIRRATPSFHAQKTCDCRTYSYTLPSYAFAPCTELTNVSYRITEEQIADVDNLLAAFVGTHNFYNFTARREHSDQSCRRFIISFKCDQPFIYHDPVRNEDVEFLTVYIKGQSFMLHQIRKMIGSVISIIRGFMYKSDLQKAFEKYRMDIPKAPGNGLLLEQLHYERYDKRYGRTHAKLDDWGDAINAKIQDAKEELIMKEMLSNEMMQWLTTLPLHRFMCDPEDEGGESCAKIFEAAALATNTDKKQLLEQILKADDDDDEPLTDKKADNAGENFPSVDENDAKAESTVRKLVETIVAKKEENENSEPSPNVAEKRALASG